MSGPSETADSTADRQPLFLVLSGPSGVGKDTILHAAIARDADLATIVTAKTRPARPNEQHGVHHLFLSDAEFDALLTRDAFLEHAEIYGHRSGVPRDQVRDLLDHGRTVIVRTDIQGARTLHNRVSGAVLVFLSAPDRKTLAARLGARNTDAPADLDRRLAAADDEMAQASWFNHVIINHEGRESEAVNELLRIIAQEKARVGRPVPVV